MAQIAAFFGSSAQEDGDPVLQNMIGTSKPSSLISGRAAENDNHSPGTDPSRRQEGTFADPQYRSGLPLAEIRAEARAGESVAAIPIRATLAWRFPI